MGFKKTLPTYWPFGTLNPDETVTPLPVTGTNVYTSEPTFIANLDNIGCMVEFSGTPTGTVVVNVSNDGIVFTDLTFDPPITQPTGIAVTYGINLNQVPWPYVEFQYTNSSGSGGVVISIFGKDLN